MKKDIKTDKPLVEVKKKKSILSFTFGFNEEKEYFIENLAMLLASGMDIIEALNAIKGEVKSSQLINIIDELTEDINVGFSLHQALAKTGILPGHIIALIKIGEESGRLHESLKVVVIQQAKTRSFRSKIRAAMMYPVFVMAIAAVVGIGIAWFILPRLASVFSQLNLELPLITRLLIGLGKFLSVNGATVVPGFIAILVLIIYFLFFFSKTKFIGQAILFSIPGIKNLIREAELARFGYVMGTLLQAGLPILEALSSLKDSGTLRPYSKVYTYLHDEIQDGRSFEECFAINKKIRKYIPGPIQSLISVGERSGSLGKIFLNISENFEAKTELTTKNLSVILEPLLLVIVWLGVVAVALAVILPIYSLVGGLSNKPTTGRGSSTNKPTPISSPASNTAATTSSMPSPALLPVNTSSVIIVVPKSSVSSTVSSTVVSSPVIFSEKILEVLTTPVGYLNIRAASSSKAELIRKASAGERLNFIEKQDGWYEVTLGIGQIGWVSAQYVKEVTSTP